MISSGITDSNLTDKQKAQLDALLAFDREARRLSLPYILVKGFALSQLVYGNPFARDSSDVDVIVSHDDLSKADCAARRAGFRQPSETYRARQLLAAGALDERLMEGISAPFCFRTNPAAPHVAPYHRFCEHGHALFEVHDRFHGLSSDDVPVLLWNRKTIGIAGRDIPTCSDGAALLLLLLSIHDDAETVRGNLGWTRFAHTSAEELHNILLSGDAAGMLVEASDLSDLFGVRRQCEESIADLLALHPGDANLLNGRFVGRASRWGISYLIRLQDAELRKRNAESVIAKALGEYAKDNGIDDARGEWRALRTANCTGKTGFEWSTSGKLHAVGIRWRIPLSFRSTFDDLVFLVTLLSSDRRAGCFGKRIRLFMAQGEWKARVTDITSVDFDEHASRKDRGQSIPVACRETGQGLDLAFSISVGVARVAAVPSVHVRQIASHYHLIAGRAFADVISEAMEMAS